MATRSSPQIPPDHVSDAEMALAIMREDLNRALFYRKQYNAEKHNICLAIIDFRQSARVVLAAYSNNSAIPESTRLGLNLVPDTYGMLPMGSRFGCDGMAQYHTEPKLLNFLCASPDVRRRSYQPSQIARKPPRGVSLKFFADFVDNQRRVAIEAGARLDSAANVEQVTIASEIDCCPTCVEYSIRLFRQRFGKDKLVTVELGKAAGQPTKYQTVVRNVIG